MSEDTKKSKSGGSNSSFLALIGILVVLAIAILVNYLIGSLGLLNGRLDLTQDKLYTLSQGSKNILGKVDSATPVTIRYYVTDDDRSMPDGLKTYARNVQDLLNEYKKAGKGSIVVERYNPAPNTEAEDAAILDGIQAQTLNLTDSIWLGLSISCLDQQVAIPALDPRRESLLEYDISRAVSEVLGSEKSLVGVMSPLPVAGPDMILPPQMGGGNQPPAWFFYTALERDYEVEKVAMTSAAINPEIDVLIVLHPADIDATAQFAIDQYVLDGGKVIACLDAHCLAAQMSQPQANPMMGQAPPPQVGTISNMERLLGAWGYTFSSQVVADMTYRTALQGGQKWPGILTLSSDAVNSEDMLTADLTDLTFVFSGAFEGEAVEGLQQETLVATSALSQLVNPFDAENNAPSLMTGFVASDVEMPLVMRLSGNFKTAFPEGSPAAAAPAEGEEVPAVLTEGNGEGSVVLVADADWIFDQFCVQLVQVMGGGRAGIPRNSNLPLMQNATDQLAGDSDLIEVRSRASSRRPFDKIEKMTADAEKAYSQKIGELENDRQMVQREITQIQSSREDDQKEILTAEQQTKLEELRDKYATGSEELRQVQKDLTKDIDRLEAKLTMANVLAMPLVVAWIGIAFAFFRKFRTSAR